MSQKPKAAIFDMDGTMIDNHMFHKKAWLKFCERRGMSFDDDEFRTRIFGKTSRDFTRILFGDISEEEIQSHVDEKESLYRELYQPHIAPLDGLMPFLADLRKSGYLLGVATSAPRENLNFSLHELGLIDTFDSLMCLDDIENEKPDPEIYLSSMNLLGVEPSRTVVFEDSMAGILAGVAAGAHIVGLTTSLSASDMGDVALAIDDYSFISSKNLDKWV